jgi:phage-related protein
MSLCRISSNRCDRPIPMTTRRCCGLAKLRNRQYHRQPLSKALGDGLFELRHVGKLNTRIIWFFMKERRIIAVHGIRNKGQAIPAHDLKIASERMRDWQERFA